jgi:hypothetical protein
MNPMQKHVHDWHKQVAQRLGFGQSTFKHRVLQGTLSAPSATGVVVLTPPGPQTADETTTDTKVWAIWEQKLPRTTASDDAIPGKTLYENWTGQFPLYDDSGNAITVNDEDWLEDTQSPPNRYRVQNPKVDSALSFIVFEMERVR